MTNEYIPRTFNKIENFRKSNSQNQGSSTQGSKNAFMHPPQLGKTFGTPSRYSRSINDEESSREGSENGYKTYNNGDNILLSGMVQNSLNIRSRDGSRDSVIKSQQGSRNISVPAPTLNAINPNLTVNYNNQKGNYPNAGLECKRRPTHFRDSKTQQKGSHSQDIPNNNNVHFRLDESTPEKRFVNLSANNIKVDLLHTKTSLSRNEKCKS